MLSKLEKAQYLESYLSQKPNSYADMHKSDIATFIEEFVEENPLLNFLDKLSTKEEIETWVDDLTSSIVLKFDEGITDFIYEYIS